MNLKTLLCQIGIAVTDADATCNCATKQLCYFFLLLCQIKQSHRCTFICMYVVYPHNEMVNKLTLAAIPR